MEAAKAQALAKKLESALAKPNHVAKIQIGKDMRVTVTQSLVAKVVNVEVSVPPDIPGSVSES